MTRHSEEHTRFENLLRAVVSVPNSEVKKRMEDERTAKEWAKENGQRTKRARPIVSPVNVSTDKGR